jgi:hypothetical protein
MNYSFDDADAKTNHPTQYFEMFANRGIVQDGFKAVTFNGRNPWVSESELAFEDQVWELYNIVDDPAEAHNLMEGRSISDLDDPMVKKLIELVGLWWAEAGRYGVLPVDERFNIRLLGRGDLYVTRDQLTFFPGAVRIPEGNAPDTKNRSWTMTAEVEIPEGGADGPICAQGGDTNGWSLYVKDDKAVYCYNLIGLYFTYIRSEKPLTPGRHSIRYEFEKTGGAQYGAGGTGRLYVDGKKAGEAEIPKTTAFIYSLDETFDVGCDKGSPVTEEYAVKAEFTGKIIKIDFDLKPDLHHDEDQHIEAHTRAVMIQQ